MTALTIFIVGLLAFAHAYAPKIEEGRCFTSFAAAQWPKWIGCAMAAHQDLAGGLIGSSGALFAAWLAYVSVQIQIGREEARRLRGHLESKEIARKVLGETIEGAAIILREISNAIEEVDSKASGGHDKRIGTIVRAVRGATEDPLIRDLVKELGPSDRNSYIMIVSGIALTARTFEEASALSRGEALRGTKSYLMSMRYYLNMFDLDLARRFDELAEIPVNTPIKAPRAPLST